MTARDFECCEPGGECRPDPLAVVIAEVLREHQQSPYSPYDDDGCGEHCDYDTWPEHAAEAVAVAIRREYPIFAASEGVMDALLSAIQYGQGELRAPRGAEKTFPGECETPGTHPDWPDGVYCTLPSGHDGEHYNGLKGCEWQTWTPDA